MRLPLCLIEIFKENSDTPTAACENQHLLLPKDEMFYRQPSVKRSLYLSQLSLLRKVHTRYLCILSLHSEWLPIWCKSLSMHRNLSKGQLFIDPFRPVELLGQLYLKIQ